MIFTAWCACCAMSAAAQDCEISLTIAKAAQKEELPSQVQEILAYIIHSGFISGYQNRYGDNLKPPTNVYHRMTA